MHMFEDFTQLFLFSAIQLFDSTVTFYSTVTALELSYFSSRNPNLSSNASLSHKITLHALHYADLEKSAVGPFPLLSPPLGYARCLLCI